MCPNCGYGVECKEEKEVDLPYKIEIAEYDWSCSAKLLANTVNELIDYLKEKENE